MKNINKLLSVSHLVNSCNICGSIHRMILIQGGVALIALVSVQAQPVIYAQPKDQFVDLGENISFNVSASSGAPLLTYQWFFNRLVLPGATNSSLPLIKAVLAMTGNYFVIVSDASGATTSQVVRLKVFAAAPHGFSGIKVTPDRSVALGLAGGTPALFQQYFDLHPLDFSSNLVDWSPLLTLVRTNASTNSLSFLNASACEFNVLEWRTPPSPDRWDAVNCWGDQSEPSVPTR